ncbi:hypothetical protein HOY82DRAFT_67502 [Tuber indicum]|nr:hypothetical protein HOY82DRAFT_67502 [Tuber indicum]
MCFMLCCASGFYFIFSPFFIYLFTPLTPLSYIEFFADGTSGEGDKLVSWRRRIARYPFLFDGCSVSGSGFFFWCWLTGGNVGDGYRWSRRRGRKKKKKKG